MKTTKKSIIKKMLVDELRSPRMWKRLEGHGIGEHDTYEKLICGDLHSASDDELIELAYKLHKTNVGFFGESDYRHHTRYILTPKAYLLLMAYRNSFSTLKKYRDHHIYVRTAAIADAVTKNEWRSEYIDLCSELMKEVRQNLK